MFEKLPHTLAMETHLYDEVSLPPSVDSPLLHDSDHPPLIVSQSLQVLLSLGHDTTILLSSTVRDLDKGGGVGGGGGEVRERIIWLLY